jgi:hypothetical protein
MPRRVIYIENPSSGSNYRTIDGGGGSSPKQPTKKKQPKQKQTNQQQGGYGTQFATGYAGNYTQGTPNWSNWYTNFPNDMRLPNGVFTGELPDDWNPYVVLYEDHTYDYLPAFGNRPLTQAEKIVGMGYLLLITAGAGGLFAGVEGSAAIAGAEGVQLTNTTLLAIAGTQGSGIANTALLAGGITMSINDSPRRFRNPDGSIRVQYADLYTYIKYEVLR